MWDWPKVREDALAASRAASWSHAPPGAREHEEMGEHYSAAAGNLERAADEAAHGPLEDRHDL